ncbi:MAG TPA: hypothetical protein VKV36_06745 [Acidimicrobiales bacterium]|nr:hypothetical protein [Acidimicrobiales bacterium]
MSRLRTVKGYTLGGLAPTPVSFDYLTGHFPKTECGNFVQLQGAKFVPVPASGKPICGTLFAYTGS